MSVVSIVAGPLIGSVIGYFTNYIAVKMLFRPLRPVMVGGKPLPFTPGMIPKRKPELARALGKAVGENLFTKGDVKALLMSEPLEKKVVDGIMDRLTDFLSQSVSELAVAYAGEELYEEKKQMLMELVSDRIVEEILKLDIEKLIREGGMAAAREKLQGSMLSMFITDDLIASLAEPIGGQVRNYIEDHGEEMLMPVIERQVTELSQAPLADGASVIGLDLRDLRERLSTLYGRLIEEHTGHLLEDFDIAGTVQKKVDEMDVEELERLVLSVMKKELDGIVNLGALIGFVLGLLNIWL